MGRLAVLLSFLRTTKNNAKLSDVKVNPGGGANVTAEHFSAPGDDAHPLPGDYVALNSDSGTGRESAVGYLDPTNEPKALPGDKRIYARDGNGALIAEIWLKNTGEAVVSNDNGSVKLRADGGVITTTPGSTFDAKEDGSIKGNNDSGYFELAVNGDFLVNNVTIDPSGNISTSGTLNAQDVTADNEDVTLSTHETPSFGAPPTPGT